MSHPAATRDGIDQVAADELWRLAAATGMTVPELLACAARSPILRLQLLDPQFASLAEEPEEDFAAFSLRVANELDNEELV